MTLSPADVERFSHIRREVDFGYAITMKDLRWLVRLVEKLDRGNPLPELPKTLAEIKTKKKPRPRRKALA